MNRERVEYALTLVRGLTDADVDPSSWETCWTHHLATSPLFVESGGAAGFLGVPIFNERGGQGAVEEWLAVKGRTARALCGLPVGFGACLTRADVIRALEGILNGD